ncbi:response regulator [Lentisphaera marina]|uniref:protein kinase domain-containing protein n=1 Tax=Lentisphaera marina TaxID=1111041 RepID=UPI0023654A13|nr:response regulator [Lentisphaera marina]MDD7984291.1 response regulator [Lentisphaera marina]
MNNLAEDLVLIVDDNANNLQVLFKTLAVIDAKILVAKGGVQALTTIEKVKPSLILLDIMMPDKDGYEVCAELKENDETKDIPIIFLSALGQVQDKVKGLNLGAVDFITKPFQAEEVVSRVKTQLRLKRLTESLKNKNALLEEELKRIQYLGEEAKKELSGPLLGSSDALISLKEKIEHSGVIAKPLMLLSKPGCGESAIAREIHQASKYKDRAFVHLNCTELYQSHSGLLQSDNELIEKFSLAQGGCIYFEQINKLPVAKQEDIISYVQAHWSSGGKEDGLVIFHANRDYDPNDIHPAVLDYLCENTIQIPRLHERLADIAEIAKFYMKKYAQKLSKTIDTLSEESIRSLEQYTWPGDVNELENVIEREVFKCELNILEINKQSLGGQQTIGAYQLDSLLGEGGMGEVWRGMHQLLARPAAIKLIKNLDSKILSKDNLTQRFHREARSTANLQSPHTVTLYDYGVSDLGEFYYVMELLEGLSLGELINQFGPLQPSRALYLMKQACRSLAEAHDMGMVHRDIKPDNLFIAKLGAEYDFLKILDFGIVSNSQEEDIDLTAGQPIGTPSFMAPETAMGKELSGLADIYSLACTFYVALSGEHVFDAPTPMAVMLKHIQDEPVNIRDVAKFDTPKGFADVLMSCMSKEPADRPQSALDLYNKLDELEDEWTCQTAQDWWVSHVDLKQNEEYSQAMSDDFKTMVID